MKSNKEIKELVAKKTRRMGCWRVSPMYVGRMNRKTLGCETGSGKQGSLVYWRKWGVYYDTGDGQDTVGAPIATFSTFKEAMAYANTRMKNAKL